MKLPFDIHLDYGDDGSLPIARVLLCVLGIGVVIGLIAARIYLL